MTPILSLLNPTYIAVGDDPAAGPPSETDSDAPRQGRLFPLESAPPALPWSPATALTKPPAGAAAPHNLRAASAGDSDYELVSESDESFEAIDAPKPLHVEDYHGVEVYDAPATLPDTQRRSMVGSLACLVAQINHASSTTKRVIEGGVLAVREEALSRDILNPATYSPITYLGPFIWGLAAAGAAEGFNTWQGHKEVNHERTLLAAQEHLRLGAAGFSQDQKDVVAGWLREAQIGLDEYANGRSKGTSPATPAAPPPKAAKKTPKKTAKKAAKEAATSDTEADEEPLPHTAVAVRIAPQRGTVGGYYEAINHAVEARNPTMDLLRSESPRLASVLEALQNFIAVPYRVRKTPLEVVNQNAKTNPALGSAELIHGLMNRARILAGNATKPTREQSKKILIAASGPGTGKTTGLSKMAEWCSLPLCMLTGEAFKKMPNPEDDSAFELFERWVSICVLEKFRVDDNGVVNGILLLDDFHFALEEGGPLAADSDRYSREQFFLFLKNMGDANQESVLEVELAPGRPFPLNLGRVQLIITLNRIPDELGLGGESALRSRIVYLNCSYPNDADRRSIATDYALPEIKRAVASICVDGEGALHTIDEKLARDSILAVAAADISVCRDKYKGQQGFRGLMELLEQYKQHVLGKLDAAENHVKPRLFGFAGPPDFVPEHAMQQIEDYKKVLDQNMAQAEAETHFAGTVATLRSKAPQLPGMHAATILQKLEAIDDNAGLVERKGAVDDIHRRFDLYAHRVRQPAADVLGETLEKRFNYFRAASGSTDGEADRFGPLVEIVSTIYWRMAAAREGLAYEVNRPICVRFSESAAYDPTLYDALGEALGGLPVRRLVWPDDLIYHADPYGLVEVHPLRARARSMVLLETAFYDAVLQSTVYLQSTVHNGRSYFYYATRTEYRILTQIGLNVLLASAKSGAHFRPSPSHYHAVSRLDDITAAVASLLMPRLNLFDSVLQQPADKQETSTGETLAIVLMAEMHERIAAWATYQENPKHESAGILFENYLFDQLNAAEVVLKDGTTFDPRSLTVFLVSDPNQRGTGGVHHTAPENMVDWNMGVPPIEGRAARARSIMQQTLATMAAQLRKQMKWAGKATTDATFTLTPKETEILDALIAYDRDVAHEVREVGLTLPPGVLDKCVAGLAQALKQQKFNPFGLPQAFPELKTFAAEWREIYQPERDEIQRTIEHRQRLEALRHETERLEAQRRAAEAAELARPKDTPRRPKRFDSDASSASRYPRSTHASGKKDAGERSPRRRPKDPKAAKHATRQSGASSSAGSDRRAKPVRATAKATQRSSGHKAASSDAATTAQSSDAAHDTSAESSASD